MFSPEPNVKWSQVIFQYILSSLISLAYGIASIIIYNMNKEINCTTEGILLQDWVLGSGLVYCIAVPLNATIFGIRNKYGAMIYYTYLFLLYFPFNIAWSIVGSVMLFKYSMNCVDNALWQMAISSLIFHWITILFISWEMISKCIKIQDTK